MKPIEISDELAAAVEAIAAYEHRTAAEVVAPVLARLVEDHHARLAEVLAQLAPTVDVLGRAVKATIPPQLRAEDQPATNGGAAKVPPKAKPKPKAKPAKSGARTCDVAGCSKPYQARGMCPMHYSRWKVGTLTVAPDGTPSPANKGVEPTAATAPSNGAGTDPRGCVAKGCTQPRIAKDAKLCRDHTTTLRDMAASLRPRFGADAGQEALARLIDGRSAAA